MENSTAVLLISMMVLMISLYYYDTERKILLIKAEQENILTESETRCSQEVNKLREEFGVANQKVAFHTRLMTELTLSGTQTVVFDRVDLNIGSGYNQKTGYFTAPMDGLYYFASSFLARFSASLHLELIKNDEVIAYGHTNYLDGEAGSMLVTIELKQGDNVRIRHMDGQPNQHIYAMYSSFTGFKL